MGDLLIHPRDNVAVRPENGHKYAVRDIARGESVVKYGFPIGEAARAIKAGEHVHTHNLKSRLSGCLNYTYTPVKTETAPLPPATVNAYVRADGRIGIRNEVWIIPTVGCVNKIAERIAEQTGAFCFSHPYGCSQLGDDLRCTQKLLAGLIRHPNAGGVLALGLGCENNTMAAMREAVGPVDESRRRNAGTRWRRA